MIRSGLSLQYFKLTSNSSHLCSCNFLY